MTICAWTTKKDSQRPALSSYEVSRVNLQNLVRIGEFPSNLLNFSNINLRDFANENYLTLKDSEKIT